jgi:hypothetical protein
MVIFPCDCVKTYSIGHLFIDKLPVCVRYCLVTEQHLGSCKILIVSLGNIVS